MYYIGVRALLLNLDENTGLCSAKFLSLLLNLKRYIQVCSLVNLTESDKLSLTLPERLEQLRVLSSALTG